MPWNVRGLQVEKHKAKYLRATTGRAVFENGFTFYRLEERVAIGRREWYYRQPNMAQGYITADNKFRAFADSDGIQLYDNMINLDGTPKTDSSVVELVYRTLPEKNFSELEWD